MIALFLAIDGILCFWQSTDSITKLLNPTTWLGGTLCSSVSERPEYNFPDPIPEYAGAETEKFRNHVLDKLSKKDIVGDSLEEVVGLCTEILRNFLHTEYGGQGTLLVIALMEMACALEERGLPGSPQAARAAVKWAQKHVDNDWDEWTSNNS